MANIFIVADHKDGQLKRVTLELLSEFQKQGADPVAVVLGGPEGQAIADTLAKSASKVVFLENAGLTQYTNEAYANALHAYLSKQSPHIVATGATSTGKDFLPRLAAKFAVGIAVDCTEFKLGGDKVTVQRPVYAGKCSKTVEFAGTPAVFSVRPNVLPANNAAKSGTVEKIAADIGQVRSKISSVMAAASKKVELTEADIIISGGRSLKSADNFKILFDCASVIGAAVGASRAAVDAGFAPHDMQVGQTGKTVSPKLYIACGISGAIQHLAGMRTSKVIVAINKDPEAPIFQKADYSIVGDLFEIIPKLTEEFKKLKASS